MLSAIIHGKAGRIDVSSKTENISWRELYKSREDLLTAAFFSRWSYLSNNSQHILMSNWIDKKSDFKDFKIINFWPRYNLPDKEELSYIEPDILIEFERSNVLIEVKPPLGGDQYFQQWEKEIAGYYSWADSNNIEKPLYFLAIGRIGNVEQKWKDNVLDKKSRKPEQIIAIKWRPIASSIFNLLESKNIKSSDAHILTDILKALELYGIFGHKFQWNDFHKKEKELPTIDLGTFSAFKNVKSKQKILNSPLNLEVFHQWMI